MSQRGSVMTLHEMSRELDMLIDEAERISRNIMRTVGLMLAASDRIVSRSYRRAIIDLEMAFQSRTMDAAKLRAEIEMKSQAEKIKLRMVGDDLRPEIS